MKRPSRYLILFTTLFLLEDVLILNVFFFIMACCEGLREGSPLYEILLQINLGYVLSFLVIRPDFDNIKQLNFSKIVVRDFTKMFITAAVVLLSLMIMKDYKPLSYKVFATYLIGTLALMIISHVLTRRLLTFFVMRKSVKAVILGYNDVSRLIVDTLKKNVYQGVEIVGVFDSNPRHKDNVTGDLAAAQVFCMANDISLIYCALPTVDRANINDFRLFADRHVIQFYIVPDIEYFYAGHYSIVEYIGSMPVFSSYNFGLHLLHNAMIKRGLDILISGLFLCTIFPIIFIVCAILIKLSSPGPVFFMQKRTGLNGKTFSCFKFRSMRVNADADRKQATANDDRTTRIGQIMRKTSIDELPQFINVLIGDMSLIGPRPHMLQHTAEFASISNRYMVRHFIRPGITGLAQIRGLRGEVKEVSMLEKRIRADIWYTQNWSLWLDIEILFATVLLLFKGDKNAY